MLSSKEALEDLLYYANLNFERENERKTELTNKLEKMDIADNEENFKVIEKDLDQLEEYRKIEEELGIDLITLFKALRDGVFINEDGSVYKDCIKSIEHWSDGWGFISNDDYIEVLFKDYGISWTLTEEEFYLKLGRILPPL